MKVRQVILILSCILLLCLQQLRLMSAEHRVNDLFEAHLRLQHQMVEFMENTNSSIRNNTSSIESQTRILRILIHPSAPRAPQEEPTK